MIGIRCHHPHSLLLDCRLRLTTMPVRAPSQKTALFSLLHTISTSDGPPPSNHPSLQPPPHALVVDTDHLPPHSISPQKPQTIPLRISSNQSFPRRDP
jgi:hypothetical protein